MNDSQDVSFAVPVFPEERMLDSRQKPTEKQLGQLEKTLKEISFEKVTHRVCRDWRIAWNERLRTLLLRFTDSVVIKSSSTDFITLSG